jgi:hypothetical protein
MLVVLIFIAFGDSYTANISVTDEMCVCLNNPQTCIWINGDVTRLPGVRCTVASTKRMFWIDFLRTGIGAVVLLPADPDRFLISA